MIARVSNSFRIACAMVLLGSFAPFPTWGQDNESYHFLEELKLRQGAKPYDRMFSDGSFPSERTVFFDSITGVETWKVTHDPGLVRHEYYDIPVWNSDGTFMFVRHEGADGFGPNWLLPASGASLSPLPESSVVDLKWSWLDPSTLYGIDGTEAVVVDWPTWTVAPLFDFATLPQPLDDDQLNQVPPHPLDDRLLFNTREVGRFFSLDVGTSTPTELATDGRWATFDGIHRIRWTKDADHHIFLGQNNRLVDGVPLFERRQFIVPFVEALDPLDECILPGVEDRTKHPDTSMDGLAVVGFIEHNFWVYYCNGEAPSRILYGAPDTHHGSVLYDMRGYVIDNEDGVDYEVSGLNVSDSNTYFTLDGRSQMVLNYHYSLQADLDAHTEPRTASSPDGTKVTYDSNMMNRGVPGDEGLSDVYVAVVRRPFPPTDLNAVAGNGDIRLSWNRPLHSETPIHWNPGNLSREISGYHVWRSDQSGGPWMQVNDSEVTDTQYVDASAVADQVYYYAVQAVEPSGLGSVLSEEDAASTSASGWQGGVRLHYEAELAGIELPLVGRLDPQDASGEWFVGTFAIEPDPVFPMEDLPAAVVFNVRAPSSGVYHFWIRARAFDGASGSFDVDVDGEALANVTIDQDAWTWLSVPVTKQLQTGTHTLSVATADLELGVDLIAVTDDSSYVPVGRAGSDTTAPAPPSNTRLTVIDGSTKKLVWDPSPDSDVQYYNVYCGRDDSYPLANPNRLYSPVDPLIWDWGIPAGANTVYKITAVDRFGNESIPVVHDPATSGEGTAPDALDDAYAIDEDTVLAPGGIGVLENDEDLDGDVLTAILIEDVVNGTLALNSDGSFEYTPNLEFSGVETFVYRADDGSAESLEATVTITVNFINDTPITAADAFTTDEDRTLVKAKVGGVLSNDTDAELDELSTDLVTDVSSGVLALDPDGAFVYTPSDDFFGTDSFTYRAFDGNSYSVVTTASITVEPIDDDSTAVTDAYSTGEGVTLLIAAPGVLENDIDVDGDTLTAVLDQDVEDGTLELQADGSFLYTPDADFNGTDRFYYRVDDGTSLSNVVPVVITIDNQNDAPVAVDDSYSGTEDFPIVVSGSVLNNDSDVDGDSLTAVLLSMPGVGSLTFDATDGSFTFQGPVNWNGTTSFTYAASDGQLQSLPATVTLTLDAVNDVPRVRSLRYTIQEDKVLSIAAPGVLARARDSEGDDLTAVLSSDVNRGDLVFNSDGSFVYTPDPNDSGQIVFRYQADDGSGLSPSGRVDITVVEVPDPPTALPDSYQAVQDVELVVPVATGVLANDSDGDGDPLTAELLVNPTQGTLTEFKPGGRFDYRPDPGFVGVDTFTYRATDGTLNSGSITVTIQVAAAAGAETRTGTGKRRLSRSERHIRRKEIRERRRALRMAGRAS